MKKAVSLIIAAAVVIPLSACAGRENEKISGATDSVAGLESIENVSGSSETVDVDATTSASVLPPGNAAKIAGWIQEEYDLSGKTIVPFCSHGGGRFGQSLTAIAKLAPDSTIGEGLAISYSGGSSMPSDVSAWLEENNVSVQ